LLLEQGADPNAAGAGYTPLHAAVLRGDVALVQALLAHGANPNVGLIKGTPVRYVSQDYALNVAFLGATPFWLAARFAEPEIMLALIAGGADPRRTIEDQTTPLMATLAGGGSNVVGTTSDRRERVLTPTELDARDQDAEERAMMAAFRLAMAHGGDVNLASQNGDTALHLAAARGYLEASRLLIAAGADIHAANRAGDTPLHGAATQAHAPVIELLGMQGARLDVTNKRGLTPLAIATASGGGGASIVPEARKQAAADLLRRLGATH
jgi:ankyrin repeat protein